MTAQDRAARTVRADADVVAAFVEAGGGPRAGVSVLAVGGYGRGDLAPHSDLDVVLLHADDVDPGPIAERIWYPLWDSGARLDHSVRGVGEMGAAASADLKVMLGLLDARHLAGDADLSLAVRSELLAQWRREARTRVPELAALVRARHERVGELAHLAVPDLKEAAGGLRDAVVLNALVATWLVDVPHVALAAARRDLLDVRDVLHAVAGRPTDRIAPDLWPDLALGLGEPDGAAAQRRVRDRGRRLAHLSRLTWRRVEAGTARPRSSRGARRPALEPVGGGVAVSRGEVVLDRDARPARDPLLLLAAAAEASERDLVLAPATAARLARECPPVPTPWPDGARGLLVRLLAGPGLLGVWETLEETGALAGLLPEWERIRLLPHASVIHRFTVDRHVIETCREAAGLIRRVARPDVLLMGALLHDIGKGSDVDHGVAGEPIAREVAARVGFDAREVDLIGRLVRWHLLLAETATTRDLDDPATWEQVTSRLGDVESVTLLAALTEADARATAPQAWTRWRAGLVTQLVERCAEALQSTGSDIVRERFERPDEPIDRGVLEGDVRVTLDDDAAHRIRVVAPDRIGLLADVAAVLAMLRVPVHAARAWVVEGDGAPPVGVSLWDVAGPTPDPAVVRERLVALAAGRVDANSRMPRVPGVRPGRLEPTVAIRHDASSRATVIEVRAEDGPGILHVACAALASLGLGVASAHVATLGPQAVDVFYVREPGAGALTDDRAAAAAHAVRSALSVGLSVGLSSGADPRTGWAAES